MSYIRFADSKDDIYIFCDSNDNVNIYHEKERGQKDSR